MNITFFIGNGFNLNLGLHTAYSDFLTHYLRENAEDSKPVAFLKKLLAAEEPSALWSEAELFWGKTTAQFLENDFSADDFYDAYEDFCANLAAYQQKEEKRIPYDALNKKIVEGFSSALLHFADGFREMERAQLLQFAESFDSRLCYRFIDFNYTSALEKCLNAVNAVPDSIGSTMVHGKPLQNRILSHLHIHGDLNKSMVLGVNDASQIAGTALFDGLGQEYTDQLIKQCANEMYKEDADKKAADILKASDLIFIYGMSLGITDKMWWERICELMKQNKRLHIILHAYDAPQNQLIARRLVTFEKQRRAEFLQFADCNEEELEDLSNRIHIDSSNLFAKISGLADHL